MDARWVREPEARRHCGGLSHGYWHELRKRGLVQPVYLGRVPLYDLRDLDRFLERLKAEQRLGGIEPGAVAKA